MSKMFEYKGTVVYQNSFAVELSKFMNASDHSGEWGTTKDNITFKSASDKPMAEFENHIKEAYESAGGRVFEVNLYRRQLDTYAPDTVPDTSIERTPNPAKASPNRQLKEESKQS